MSLHRIFRWTCDICGQSAYRESYGLPEGFRYVLPGSSYRNRRAIHACFKCRRQHCITDDECAKMP